MTTGGVILRAMLDGITGAGLFRRLDYPGAPKEFVDSRPPREVVQQGVMFSDEITKRVREVTSRRPEENKAHVYAAPATITFEDAHVHDTEEEHHVY